MVKVSALVLIEIENVFANSCPELESVWERRIFEERLKKIMPVMDLLEFKLSHLVQVFSDSSVTYEIDANRITISNGNFGISAFTE